MDNDTEHPTTIADLAKRWESEFLVEPLRAPSTIQQRQFMLRVYVVPKIGDILIGAVTPQIFWDMVIMPIIKMGRKDTARTVKELCGQIFRHAVAQGWAKSDPTAELPGELPAPERTRRATITDTAGIGRLLVAIDFYGGSPIVKKALQLSPLVMLSPKELRHGLWAEIDWRGARWNIPAERMKVRKDHVVPLSTQVMALLRELHEFSGDGPLMFPGQSRNGKPLGVMTVNTALKLLDYDRTQITADGFRTMAASVLLGKGFNAQLVELQMAYSPDKRSVSRYRYIDCLEERAKMMQDLADTLDIMKEKAKP